MMVVTNANLPSGMRKQRRYTAVIEALRLGDGWVSVLNDDIAGVTRAQKQTSILAACHRASLQVATRTTPTELFVRNLTSPEVQDAN